LCGGSSLALASSRLDTGGEHEELVAGPPICTTPQAFTGTTRFPFDTIAGRYFKVCASELIRCPPGFHGAAVGVTFNSADASCTRTESCCTDGYNIDPSGPLNPAL
jgi:hypothetical protein